MKNKISITLMAGLTTFVLLAGCNKKDETTPDTTTPTTGITPSIQIAGSYGTLVAIRTVSYTTVGGFTIPVETNTAVAAFPTAPGASTFVDAGSVTLNSKTLTRQSNNSYVYQDLLNPLSFSSITWAVSGAGSIPAINYTDDKPVPDYTGYNDLPGTLTRSAGLDINLSGKVSGADSIFVIVADMNSNYILRRLAGNASSCTFSAGELNTLAAGTGMIQVVPWNYNREDFSDKDFYFVIESVWSKIGVTLN